MKISQPVESLAVEDQAAPPTPGTAAANSLEPLQDADCNSPTPSEPIPETLELVTDFITVRLEGEDLTDDDVPEFDSDHREPCTICHEPGSGPSDLSNPNAMIKLPCGHAFGWQCWTTWISTGNEYCPMCRRPCRHYVEIDFDTTHWTADQIHAGLTYPEPAQKPDFTNCHTRRYYELIWRQIIYTTPVFERMAAFSHDRMVHALAAVIERAIENSPGALDWWVAVYIKLRAGIDEYWNTSVTEDINGDVWDMRVELDDELRDFSSVPETMTRYLPWVMVEVWQMASYS